MNKQMKPILFNTAMVRAIMDGRKTVTRRLIKQQPIDSGDCKHELQTFREIIPECYPDDYSAACRKCGYGVCPSGESIYKPPCVPGDVLYVRETWGYDKNIWLYKADFSTADLDRIASITKWRPSIHMPKEAARIFLRVTNVRVERLQDITPEQIDAEGCKEYAYDAETGELKPSSAAWFKILWDSTIKYKEIHLYGWDANPWVWVIEFERISREEAHHE